MDLALTVLFHRFQIIFDWIRLTFSIAIGTIKISKCHQNAARELQLFPQLTSESLEDRVREHKNKQAPREPE